MLSIYSIFALFCLGLIMIIKGSDWFVGSVIWITKKLNISEIIVGATIVSLCTTLPEAIVSVSSVLKGNTDMAVGNALGSIACNTGLILGITLIITRPPLRERKKLVAKGVFLLALLIFLFVVSFAFGEITRVSGIILLMVLGFYTYSNIKSSVSSNNKDADVSLEEIKDGYEDESTVKNIMLFIVGLAFTLTGAELLVANGEKIAVMLNVPDVVIGLTMTAFGTSLPELMTAVTAIRKKACNISIGNILGANILNIVLVIGASSTILPIYIDRTVLMFHLPFVLFIAGITVFFAHINKNGFKRRNGFMLLTSYIVYVILTFNG